MQPTQDPFGAYVRPAPFTFCLHLFFSHKLPITVGNLVLSLGDGKHSIGTNELVWRGPGTMARDAVAF